MGHLFRNIIGLFRRKEPAKFISLTSNVGYSKTYNIDYEFGRDFYLNLKRTIAWTERIISRIDAKEKINYGKVLRTTNPIYDGKPFYRFYDTIDYLTSTQDTGFDYNALLNEALSVRHDTILPQRNLEEVGKILKFEIDITTHDGAPCAESGFVDESDIPPIDTWFYITTKYLYCWIPTMFIDKMQGAIDVEIFGSYNWLEEIAPEVNRQIFNSIQQSGS
jgi:hypothetical protein